MSKFDMFEDPFPAEKPKPQTYEMNAQLVLHHPVEIDMSQPNRAERVSFDGITGIPGTKLIAEINTPNDYISVLHSKQPEGGAIITLTGKDAGAHFKLEPGIALDVTDLNDKGETGKCMLLLDPNSEHLDVYTKNQDPEYKVASRVFNDVPAPLAEAFATDPEL